MANVDILDSHGTTKTVATETVSGVEMQVSKLGIAGEAATVLFQDKVLRSDTFTTTANGATQDISKQGHSKFGAQVTKTGAVTSWTVVLEISLDGTTFTTVLTHTNVAGAGGDGLMVFSLSPAPALYWRLRCSAISLGGGTNVIAKGLSLP